MFTFFKRDPGELWDAVKASYREIRHPETKYGGPVGPRVPLDVKPFDVTDQVNDIVQHVRLQGAKTVLRRDVYRMAGDLNISPSQVDEAMQTLNFHFDG